MTTSRILVIGLVINAAPKVVLGPTSHTIERKEPVFLTLEHTCLT